MSKETDLKRLQELATVLGRPPDLSGSAADIGQRVAEWEEEALALSGDEDAGDDNDADRQASDTEAAPAAPGWRQVKALRTLHVNARETDSDREKELVIAGELARVPEALLDRLIADGLVSEH